VWDSSGSVTQAPQREASRWPLSAVLLATLLGAATLGAAVLGNGNIAVAFAPAFAFLLLYALGKLPLRVLWFGYIALVLLLDSPVEPFAENKYHSPFRPLAIILSAQLKTVIPVGALVMSGLDLMIVSTLILHTIRRLKESPLDRDGYEPTPLPMFVVNWLCLLGIIWVTVWGIGNGGNVRFVQWQIQRNIYLPIVMMVAHWVFPGPAQMKPFMQMLTVIACVRSVIAIWLRFGYPEAEYTTAHSDSVIFAIVFCFLLLRLLHGGATRGEKWSAAPILGLLSWGMVANERRLVWVEIAVALLFVYFMSPRTLLKRRIAQITLGSIPITSVYIAAGWGSSGTGVFAPVGTLRSMVDSKSDGSTLWRDLENFNLAATFAHHPVFGTGFGHPYELKVWMPDITHLYELEPYLPHNSVVGLWAYAGYVGFTLIWLVPLMAAFICARAYYASKTPYDRTISLTAFCGVVVYLLQCYGDMGLGSIPVLLVVATTVAMVGKLAIQNGAWPRAGAAKANARGVDASRARA
jgi:hypothetical protein